ncbi:hypothetical protein R1flu_016704 [Riccia fluitans]|uniref:Protein kinase domain-containing protein n=1 Tax=Riccia fluitans TaxID=41844 RepID=A0ABD1YN46_9MARC
MTTGQEFRGSSSGSASGVAQQRLTKTLSEIIEFPTYTVALKVPIERERKDKTLLNVAAVWNYSCTTLSSYGEIAGAFDPALEMKMSHPALKLTFIVWLVCLLRVAQGKNFSISAGNFNSKKMKLLNGAHITANGSLSLIPEDHPTQAAGLGYFYDPVQLLDKKTGTTGSFSVWFSSYQEPEAYDVNGTFAVGDGMTLCFSSRPDYAGSLAKYLGLYSVKITDQNLKLFSIEYDTFQNAEFDDPAFDHVGIDILNATSVASAEAGVNIWHGSRVYLYSWIDYNGVSKVMEVRVANENSRPLTPVLNHTIDLYSIMEETMWVGFSAGTGDAYSYYYIQEWTFTSWGLPLQTGGSSSMGLIVGSVVAVVVVLALLGLGLFLFIRRRRRKNRETASPDEYLQNMVGMPDYFSYKHLSVATRAFSEASKLGEGGFGSVYKGILPSNGVAVAVKRVSADSKQGEREFLAEVSIISQLRHRNIVQLVGWCKDRGKYLLVYELMPNGSLDKALFCPESSQIAKVLSWEQRKKIISGLASALHYLHEEWNQQVIHRDVKSSNVMLDDEFNAKLGDFGLARLVDHSRNAATTLVAGTYGYIAPEATVTGKFTDKTDVYAFGAVALEVATGRKAFDMSEKEDDIQLVNMVWKRLGSGHLISVVDKRMEGNFEISEIETVLLLGLLCSHPDPNSRPSMRQVVQKLFLGDHNDVHCIIIHVQIHYHLFRNETLG